jgi:hypothetical protein
VQEHDFVCNGNQAPSLPDVKKEKPLLACHKPGLKKEYDSLIFQGITAKEILYKCGCNNKDKLYRQNAALGQNLLTCCHEVLKKLPEQ